VQGGGAAVVLKALALRGMGSWKKLDLFQREGSALKSLSHPAIPEYVDSFEVDSGGDRVFVLVQKKAGGASLQELLDTGFRFTVPQVHSLFRQLLAVLQYLGALNPPVLHRDVKPANVIVNVRRSDDVSLSLVDFGAVNSGVSRSGRGGGASFASTMVGTFGYMPPEAFGGGADVRSDLYAAGATMLFAVSGRSPSDVPQRRLKMDLESILPRPQRAELGNTYTVMRKLLEPAPEDRYRTAQEALDALTSRARLHDEPTSASSRMAGHVKPSGRARGRLSASPGASNFGAFDSAFDSAFDDGRGNGDGFYSFDSDDDDFDGVRRGGAAARVQSIVSKTLGGGAAAATKPLRRPAGSRVVIERDPDCRLLRIYIPPKGLTAQTASTGAFAVAWTGFVGFWTAGVVTGGAPIAFGLFSLPFWYAGLRMGKRVVDDVRSTTELVMSAGGGEKEVFFFSLRVAGALGDVRDAEGDSRDLDGASVAVEAHQSSQPVTSVVLREGVRRHTFGEDLDVVEQEWLCGEINSFLTAKPRLPRRR
jgi:eukaryotic-like serine/threonine-protein kinase